MILLLCAVCLVGYLFFGSQLRPHYLMPLFPVPALALGLLAAPWPPFGSVHLFVALRSRGARRFLPGVPRVVAVAVVVALAGSNTLHTWQAGFLPDRYQITLRSEQSNRVSLGQMRQVSGYIIRQAGGHNFNLLFAAPDDQAFAYQALLLAGGAHLSPHPATLRFLIVQPSDWRAAHWPAWTHRLLACALRPAARFAAGLVWMLQGTVSCISSRGCMGGAASPPRATGTQQDVRHRSSMVAGPGPRCQSAIVATGPVHGLSLRPAANESPPASPL